jgi:hypothetical protein
VLAIALLVEPTASTIKKPKRQAIENRCNESEGSFEKRLGDNTYPWKISF